MSEACTCEKIAQNPFSFLEVRISWRDVLGIIAIRHWNFKVKRDVLEAGAFLTTNESLPPRFDYLIPSYRRHEKIQNGGAPQENEVFTTFYTIENSQTEHKSSRELFRYKEQTSVYKELSEPKLYCVCLRPERKTYSLLISPLWLCVFRVGSYRLYVAASTPSYLYILFVEYHYKIAI